MFSNDCPAKFIVRAIFEGKASAVKTSSAPKENIPLNLMISSKIWPEVLLALTKTCYRSFEFPETNYCFLEYDQLLWFDQ